MKLSEAIRLGAMLKPQGFGYVFEREDKNTSCALEAARDASGEVGFAAHIWPFLTTIKSCPECGSTRDPGASVISVHLNDRHLWTRERIAAWVATIEPQENQEEIHVNDGTAKTGSR